jgi:hypothetical protein
MIIRTIVTALRLTQFDGGGVEDTSCALPAARWSTMRNRHLKIVSVSSLFLGLVYLTIDPATLGSIGSELKIVQYVSAIVHWPLSKFEEFAPGTFRTIRSTIVPRARWCT